jgi:hypothetical protein
MARNSLVSVKITSRWRRDHCELSSVREIRELDRAALIEVSHVAARSNPERLFAQAKLAPPWRNNAGFCAKWAECGRTRSLFLEPWSS